MAKDIQEIILDNLVEVGGKVDALNVKVAELGVSVSNHLAHHDALTYKIMYPILVILGAAGILFLVRHFL